MFKAYYLRHAVYRLPTTCIVLVAVLLILAGCANHSPTLTPEEPPATIGAEFIPVTRYGRYTLVELSPAASEQDLLLQIVDVSISNTLNASVGDGLRHVLQRSGYQLCSGFESDAFNSLPLPAAHYNLGPLTLRSALKTLTGHGWSLHIDQQARQVCFTQSITDPNSPIDLDLSTDPTEEAQP